MLSGGAASVRGVAKPSSRPAHRCHECGVSLAKWVGRCPECQAWGSIAEVPALPGLALAAPAAPLRPARSVDQVVVEGEIRTATGLGEFDRVLGGGLVPGQVVLLAGEPGVGKSTLLATVAQALAAHRPGRAVLYVSGEESIEQIGVRARRIGATHSGLLLAGETDLAAVLGHVEAHDPALLVVDSVQAVASSAVEGRAGGMAQVQEVAGVLVRVAKARGLPVLLVGQSTREHAVAGPRALEHMVDTVLTFEGDRQTALRLLRAVKNRYGPADEVVCFEQTEHGLREVPDPSALFRSARAEQLPGTAVAVTIDGRRALAAEVQALAGMQPSPTPRRGVTGLDTSRVAMLLAVTERHAGVRLDRDVFVATVGGLRLTDPATDLAVCLAVAGAVWEAAMPPDVAVIGEVALSGDVRPVAMLAQRVGEAARLGYRTVLVPRGGRARLEALPENVTVVELDHVARAAEALAAYKVAGPAAGR